MIDALASAQTQFLPSNKEAGRALKENSVSVNGEKVQVQSVFWVDSDLINGKFVIVQTRQTQTLPHYKKIRVKSNRSISEIAVPQLHHYLLGVQWVQDLYVLQVRWMQKETGI